MAIFSGDWHDAEGVPFDPSAFQKEDYGASGSAQKRPVGPRRTARQILATQRFTERALQWYAILTPEQRVTWEISSQALDWPERLSSYGPLPGYRNWLRSQVPTAAPDSLQSVDRAEYGDPGLVNFEFCWEAPGKVLHVQLVNTEPPIDEEHSHIEIYQIFPLWQNKSYERKWTRLVYTRSWYLHGQEHVHHWGDAAWPMEDGWTYRVFVRWWNIHWVWQMVYDTGDSP